jgi:hypothetical protein
MAREVTLPTRIYLANRSQPSTGAGVRSSSEGPIGHKFLFSANRLSKCGILMLMKSRYLVIFPRTSLDDLLQESPPQASHFVHLLMFSAFPTRSSRKRVAQWETVLRSTVYSPQTSRKAMRISVGGLPRKVSILMYDLWSSTVTVPEVPADASLTLVYSKRRSLAK